MNSNESREDGITINQTFIKMEPTDSKDDIDFVTVDNIGDFLTVLVPENRDCVDVKPMKCTKCGIIVENSAAVKAGNENQVLCQKCRSLKLLAGVSQQSKNVLFNALSDCKNLLPFRCHYCSKMYDTKETFYQHIRVHAAKKKNPYLCGMCGKNFKELIQFKKHICARNVLKCHRCSKQFESIFRLETHYLVHSKYKCDQCGKCLSSKTVLEEHKRVHTNEYPFKCDCCQRQFRQKSKFNCHLVSCKMTAESNRKTNSKSMTVNMDLKVQH